MTGAAFAVIGRRRKGQRHEEGEKWDIAVHGVVKNCGMVVSTDEMGVGGT